MTKGKKEEDLSTADVKALAQSLKAADEPALAEAMRDFMVAHDMGLEDLVALFGEVKLVAAGASSGTRKAAMEYYEQPEIEVVGEDREALELIEQVISDPIPEPNEKKQMDFTALEKLARKIKIIRKVQDQVNGRREAIKNTVFAHFTAHTGDPLKGDVVKIPSEGIQFERRISHRKGAVDATKLEQSLDRKQWIAISDAPVPKSRTLNMDKLVDALDADKIPWKALIDATSPASLSASFRVDPIKDEEG